MATPDIMERRRELVARLRLRGMTLREIADAVGKAGFYNPETDKPYTHQTIDNDLKALSEDWRKEAQESIAAHFAVHLARFQEMYRKAWQDNDVKLALSVMDRITNLLGTPRLMQAQVDLMEQALQDIRSGALEYEPLAEELGDDLAAELFAQAGITVETRQGKG